MLYQVICLFIILLGLNNTVTAMNSEGSAQEFNSLLFNNLSDKILEQQLKTTKMYADYYGYNSELSYGYVANITAKISSINFAHKISTECVADIIKNAFHDEKPLNAQILNCFEDCIESFTKKFNKEVDSTPEDMQKKLELFVFCAINSIYKIYIEPYLHNCLASSSSSDCDDENTKVKPEASMPLQTFDVDCNHAEYYHRKESGKRKHQQKKIIRSKQYNKK